MTLKAARVTSEMFQSLLEWEGGEAIAGQALKRRLKRDATGRTEVKLKVKSNGTIAGKMNVWIVWADVVATPGEQTFHPNN